MKRLLPLLLGVVLFVAGIVGLIVSLGNSASRSATTEATVLRYEVSENYDEDTMETTLYYHPVLTYAVGGKTYECTYSTGYGDQKYAEGSVVALQYDPDDPEDIVIKGDHTGTIIACAAILSGLLVGAISFRRLALGR